MPIFEYHCDACRAEFEVLHRTSDADTRLKCPKCGEVNPTKRFSMFATSGPEKNTANDNTT